MANRDSTFAGYKYLNKEPETNLDIALGLIEYLHATLAPEDFLALTQRFSKEHQRLCREGR